MSHNQRARSANSKFVAPPAAVSSAVVRSGNAPMGRVVVSEGVNGVGSKYARSPGFARGSFSCARNSASFPACSAASAWMSRASTPVATVIGALRLP